MQPRVVVVLYDAEQEIVLAEGQTIPLAWDGTDAGLGPGIDATIVAGFDLRAADGKPTAVSALAAEIPSANGSPGRQWHSRRPATTFSPPS